MVNIPKSLVMDRTPLFTVRQAEQIRSDLGLWTPADIPLMNKAPGGPTRGIGTRWNAGCQCLGPCNAMQPVSPFYNYLNGAGACPTGSEGGMYGMSDIGLGSLMISPFIWTTAAHRAIMDSYYAGLNSGIGDGGLIQWASKIFTQGFDYFPTLATDFDNFHQVAAAPPWMVNAASDMNAVKSIIAFSFQGFSYMVFGSGGQALSKAGETPGSGGWYQWNMAPVLSSVISLTNTLSSNGNNKLMVMDGLPWSPHDAITRDIASQMHDPNYIRSQSSIVTPSGTGTSVTSPGTGTPEIAGSQLSTQLSPFLLPIGIALVVLLILRGD